MITVIEEAFLEGFECGIEEGQRAQSTPSGRSIDPMPAEHFWKHSAAKSKATTLSPATSRRSISDTLYDLGVTHTRDAWSSTDSKHSLFYAGRCIGRYSAFEVQTLLEEHLGEEPVGDQVDTDALADVIVRELLALDLGCGGDVNILDALAAFRKEDNLIGADELIYEFGAHCADAVRLALRSTTAVPPPVAAPASAIRDPDDLKGLSDEVDSLSDQKMTCRQLAEYIWYRAHEKPSGFIQQIAQLIQNERAAAAERAVRAHYTQVVKGSPSGDPFAWAVFADNGSVRIWWQHKNHDAMVLHAAHAGRTMTPLFAGDPVPTDPELKRIVDLYHQTKRQRS